MTERKKRLRWKCRRGMLELDVMLERFFDQGYDQLTAAEQDTFEQLLDMPDPVLYDWFLGHAQPDHLFAHLVATIRNCAEH